MSLSATRKAVDVVVEHVRPVAVAHRPTLQLRQPGSRAVLIEPETEVVVEYGLIDSMPAIDKMQKPG